jgi:hypothetical protein
MTSTVENEADGIDTKCSCLGCQGEGTIYVPIFHRFESGFYCQGCAIHLNGHGCAAEGLPNQNTNEANRQVKTYNCKYCGMLIRFDAKMKSKNGRSIPLNPDGTTHNCPNNPYNESAAYSKTTKKIYYCNYCGKEITFDNSKKTPNGKSRPLNLDKTEHDCPNYPFKV